MSSRKPKNIDDLRGHLFSALEGLASGGMDIERAKAVAEVAQTVINSAKVEVEYLRLTEGASSAFLAGEAMAPDGTKPLPPGIVGIRRHTLAG